MTDTAIISELQQIRRDQKKILELLAGQKKVKRWVKASDILRLTGWTREMLRQRRLADLVEFKKNERGWFYNPDSINPILYEKSNPREIRMDEAGINP